MMAGLCLCLLLLGAFLTGVGTINAPDNRGTEFIIGFMDNYNVEDTGSMDNELYVTTSKTTPTNVVVQAPRYPSLGLYESFSVIAGTVKQLNISSAIRLVGTTMEPKGILVTSDQEIVVYGVNKDRVSNDAYVSLPTDVLGTLYYAVCWHPFTRQCQILIAGVHDSTSVNITLGPGLHASRNPVTWQGINYYRGDTITVTMDRLDTFQITNEDEDLTGSRITSDKPISVFSGNQNTVINTGTSSDHLVEHLTPVNTWGKRFATVPIPKQTIGDMFKFIASEDNTQVSINCNGFSQSFTLSNSGSYHVEDIASDKYCYVVADKAILTVQFSKSQTSIHSSQNSDQKSDPMMMMIPPVELYGSDYTFSTPVYSPGYYENYFLFTIKASLKDGLRIDGAPFPDSTVYNSITGTDLVAGYIPVSDGSHVIYHTSSTAIFGGYLYGIAPFETYGFSTGARLAPINGVCINTTTVAGDGLDNDCDGLIDEEKCLDNPAIDDDGDGLLDEDCSTPSPEEISNATTTSTDVTKTNTETASTDVTTTNTETTSTDVTTTNTETTNTGVTTTNTETTNIGVTTTNTETTNTGVTTSNTETTGTGVTTTNTETTNTGVTTTNTETTNTGVTTTNTETTNTGVTTSNTETTGTGVTTTNTETTNTGVTTTNTETTNTGVTTTNTETTNTGVTTTNTETTSTGVTTTNTETTSTGVTTTNTETTNTGVTTTNTKTTNTGVTTTNTETTNTDVTTTNTETTNTDVTTTNTETTNTGVTTTNTETTSTGVTTNSNETTLNGITTGNNATKSTNSANKTRNRNPLIDALLIGLLAACVLVPCCCSLLVYCVKKRCKRKRRKRPEKERLPSPIVSVSPLSFTKKRAWYDF